MAKKAPGVFKAAIPEKRFQKKLLKRIYINEDRDFLLGVYQKREDGNYHRKEELSNEEIKRLKALAKAIKKNKGVVQTVKLVIVAVIIAGIIMFNLFFKNRLLEKALESGLESAFEAKARVDDLTFSVFKGQIAFHHLEVANKDDPFKNLFELGRTEIYLNTLELLKAKFIARNVECQEIRWNTDRDVSGALERSESETPREEPGKAKAETPKKSISLGLPSINVKDLLDEQMGNLQSIIQISGINKELTELTNKWFQTLDKTKKDLDELSPKVDSIRKINVSGISSLKDIENIYSQINAVYPTVHNLKSDITAINQNINQDARKIEGEIVQISQSIDKDFTYLKSLFDLSSGRLKSLVSSIAAQYLQENLGKYYKYAMKARDYAAALIKGRKREEKKKPKRREGQNIPFPTIVYPKFLLENLAVSVGTKEGADYTEVSLKNLTSDPDLIDKPISFALHQKQKFKDLSIHGTIDARKRRKDTFTMELQVNNYPFAIQEGLEFLNFSSIRGIYQFATDFTLDRNGDSRGEAVLDINQVQIDRTKKDALVGQVVAETLTSAPNILIDVRYAILQGGQFQIQAESNIDELISAKIGEHINKIAVEYEQKIKSELMKRVEGELQKNEDFYSAFKDLEKASEDNLTASAAYEKVLSDKQRELEARVAQIQQQAEETIKKEAEKQIEQVKEKIKLPFF